IALEHDPTRKIDFTGFSRAARRKFKRQQYVANATFGYPITVGGSAVRAASFIAVRVRSRMREVVAKVSHCGTPRRV
ncbi:hypothetical protein PQQ99_11030, partial [Paraburkholderia sediminicola]|uniref:hypothetical protein n=1 Tax=Paraburkholderia sediminicola TaxID=458836 RepID=UPI0038BDEA54